MEEFALNNASLNNSFAKHQSKFSNSIRQMQSRPSLVSNSLELYSNINNNNANINNHATNINESNTNLKQSFNAHNNDHQYNQIEKSKSIANSINNNNKLSSGSVLTMFDLNSDINLNLSNISNGTSNNNGPNQTTINDLIHKLAKTDEKNYRKRVVVTTRIVFLKVGQIDTINERYDANVYIESSWEDDVIFKVLADPKMPEYSRNPDKLNELIKEAYHKPMNTDMMTNLKNIINNIHLLEYDPNMFWSPQLYIENAIGDMKEEIRHKLEIVEKTNHTTDNNNNSSNHFRSTDPISNNNTLLNNLLNQTNCSTNLTVRVIEMRKIRGIFYERLELYDFPMDLQELSVTLTSKLSYAEVELVESKEEECSINTAEFLDQQEWDLFEHVKTSKKLIYDPLPQYDKSGFTATCFIVRKPGYYLYNAYMLVFLITVLGFVPFSFEPNQPQFRCQVTGLLLLTSVNFRWIVTQRLPSVAYLTSLDKYAIGSLFSLVLFCCWHSIIGSNLINCDISTRKYIDSCVLYAGASIYVLYNLIYLMWFVKMYKINKNLKLQVHNKSTTPISAIET